MAVVRPERGTVERRLELTGEFRAYQSVDLHARVGGYIRRLFVDVGDVVKAGTPVAEVEVPELEDDLAGAEATTQQLEAEIARSERDLERARAEAEIAQALAQRLEAIQRSEPGLIAKQESEEALLRRDSAKAAADAAEAALNAARQRAAAAGAQRARQATMLDFRQITAPFAGVITERYADPGAMVRPGSASSSQPIVRVEQIHRLRLVTPIPEELAGAIRVGTPVEVSIGAASKTLNAKVSRLSHALSRSTSTMDIEIDVANPDHSLLPGMYADVRLSVDRREGVLTLPVQAINLNEKDSTVFVVDADGHVAQRSIQIGLTTESGVEISSGLIEGDSVIVGDRSRLQVGQRVQTKLVTVG